MSAAFQPHGCPSSGELERGYWEDDLEIRAHAAECAACGEEWRAIESLAALSRGGEAAALPLVHLESVRARLLGHGARLPLRRHSWRRGRICAAVAVACGIAVVVVLALRAVSPSDAERVVRRGSVVPMGNASYRLAAPQPNERVELVEGTVRVDVAPLALGERFRVVTRAGEVEVRGTSFEVAAYRGELVAVRVLSGVVIVRADGDGEQQLHTGQAWPASVPAQAPAPTRPPNPPPSTGTPELGAKPSPEPRRRALEQSDGSVGFAPLSSYDRAWSHLREGRFANAARLFDTAAKSSSGARNEDALYWAGVAWSRAGADARARSRLRRFLAAYPGSPRAGEASAMLGWSLFRGEQYDVAGAFFRRAADDPDPRVRESANRGLSALARVRQESTGP